MKLANQLVSAVLLGALCASPIPAQALSFVPTIPIMEVDELRPGMTGYGLSVFEGTEPREFKITVLGVLKNRFAGSDMIIIESHDEIMKDIGGVAGMSGSPIFVDGKLIGAFAYGWGFSVRPINGVTPIREMLKVMDLVTTESQVPPEEFPHSLAGWSQAQRELARAFPALTPREFSRWDLESLGVGSSELLGDTVTFQPLGTPLLASTRSPVVMAQLERMFAGTSLRPVMTGMQGAGMGDARGRDTTDLRPVNGGALSVIIAEGDLMLAGLGTTTYVQDDRLIAYGHPMMATGAIDVPVAVSEVVTVIPSVARPFKVGNALKTVGALRQDRLPAVGASLSAPPPRLMPLNVRLEAPETGVDQSFEFRLWNDRRMMPMISFVCIMEALETVRMGGPLGLDMQYTIRLNDGRTIEATEFVSGEMMAAMQATFGLVQTLDLLSSNPFRSPGVASVDVAMRIGDRNKMMVFDRVTRRLPQRIEAGSVLALDLEYVRFRRDTVTLPVRVRIPADLRPGNYTLRVMDGRERLALEYQNRPEFRRLDSFEKLVDALQPNFASNHAYIVITENATHPTLQGQALPGLPGSVAAAATSTIRRSDVQGSTTGRIVLEDRISVDGMLLGGASVGFEVVPRRFH